jgi:hypothetical protein
MFAFADFSIYVKLSVRSFTVFDVLQKNSTLYFCCLPNYFSFFEYGCTNRLSLDLCIANRVSVGDAWICLSMLALLCSLLQKLSVYFPPCAATASCWRKRLSLTQQNNKVFVRFVSIQTHDFYYILTNMWSVADINP